MRKATVAAVVALFAAPSADAGAIAGLVLDPEGRPVPGARATPDSSVSAVSRPVASRCERSIRRPGPPLSRPRRPLLPVARDGPYEIEAQTAAGLIGRANLDLAEGARASDLRIVVTPPAPGPVR